MLSIQNPSSDPSSLKSSSTNCDESTKLSDKVDLQITNPEVSNFSIRDYVFAARSKDIKKNWPFSLKSLQLCFKHGMKEVLPPFQPPDSVKNKPIKIFASEICSPEKKNTSHVDGEPCGPSDRVADHSIQLPEKLQSSSRPGYDNDFLSSTQSEIKATINNRQSSFLPIKTNTLLEPVSQPPGKKCKLIVKFGGNSDRSSTEDIASNCTTVSESMGSKVCPVCRTFSSSSNTTLNAHIDQCLSMEATPKWTANSKLTRHRIKPKRTRLMVDIYVDAKRCTLEELDKRNGRFFGKTIDQATEQVEIPAEGIRQCVTQVHPEESGDVGPVYIDASGTKLRILSKFNDDDDQTLSKVGENLGPRKALKGSKLCKLFSAKKKKSCQALRKRHRLAAQSKKNFYSPKMPTSQVSSRHESNLREEESVKENKHHIPNGPNPYKPSDHVRTCPKQIGLAKRTNNQDSRHVSGDFPADSNQSCSKASVVGRTRFQKFTNLSENVLSSPKKQKKIAKPIHNARFGDKTESTSEKRVDRSLIETEITDNKEISLHPMKRKFIELNKDNPAPVHGSRMLKSSSFSRTRASSPGDEVVPRKSSISPHATTPLEFSRNDVLSVTESRYGCLAFRNTDSDVNSEMDKEVEAYDSDSTDEMSFDRGDEQTFIKERTNFSKLRSYSLDEEESTDFSAGGGSEYAVEQQVDGTGSFDGSVMSWNKSVDAYNFPELTIHTDTKTQCNETLISPTDPSCLDREDNFCNQEVFAQDDCMGVESQGNCFPQVDPIPIPGPPGSFLPSPRGMGSDDFPGNSSLTTSRVHSDFVDGDSSTSPISATSSISNRAALRSDLKPFSPVEPRAVENSAGAMITTPDGRIFQLDKLSFEKRPIGFRNDDQPCCCQRKERASSHGVVVNCQESQLLKRRGDNNRPSNLNINFVADKGFLPVTKLSTALNRSLDSGVKYSDSDSPSPSASNPVLRLMGKNLMVINKDDNASIPILQAQAQPCGQINYLTSQFPTLSGASPINMPNAYPRVVPMNNYQGSTNLQGAGIVLDQLPMNGSYRDHPIMNNERQPAANGFARFWPQDQYPCSIRGESSSPVGHHVFRPVSSSSTPVRWNRTPEGFVLLQQGPFMAPPGPPSSSSSHQAGTPLYYSPSFQ